MKRFNIIKCRKSNSTVIYRTRKSDNLTRDETKVGKIYAPNLYEASLLMEHHLDNRIKRGI